MACEDGDFYTYRMTKTNTLYFAYGSDMSLRQMQQRLLEAELVLEEIPRHGARLSDYELRFAKKVPTHPTIGFASIHAVPGQVVEGVLYELPIAALKVLDDAEGVTEGHYRRVTLQVECEAIGTVAAETYVPGDDWVGEGLKPARNHLYRLLAGERFLSEPYFQRLKRTESIKVPVDDNGIPRQPEPPSAERPRYTPPKAQPPRAEEFEKPAKPSKWDLRKKK